MADILPIDLFAGYTSNGTSITIPIASLSGLSAAEVSASNGDGREVARAIITQIFTAINGLDSVNKPTKMCVSRSNLSGINSDTVRQSYTFSFDLTINSNSLSIANEI